jgi:ankyrin repeat protein
MCSLGHQLYDAALDDKTRNVRTLLSKPNAQSFINWQDQTGATPIFAAAEEEHPEVVKEMIAARCDINRSRRGAAGSHGSGQGADYCAL